MNKLLAKSWRFIKRIPWLLVLFVFILAGAGLAMLYSAAGGSMHPWAEAQLIRLIGGVFVMFVVALLPLQCWSLMAFLVYAGALALLVIVEVSGHIGMGAQRWIDLGGIHLQPSEVMKIGVILALARYFQSFPPVRYQSPRYLLVPLILLAVPVVLILRQPNLGTASLLIGMAVWVMFAAGVHRRYFVIGAVFVLVSAPIGWQFLHEYQQQRVMTFLNPSADPLGSGYNISQSIIAIGSGGMTGKGWLDGSQTQLNFLPEKQTDFIFTVLAEEFGLVGGASLILLYTLLILYIMRMAQGSVSLFGRLVCHGVAVMLCLHMFINIGMVMGLLPVVGIPLPLLSYGGSVLLSVLTGIGLVMNSWIHRDEKLGGWRL